MPWTPHCRYTKVGPGLAAPTTNGFVMARQSGDEILSPIGRASASQLSVPGGHREAAPRYNIPPEGLRPGGERPSVPDAKTSDQHACQTCRRR